KTKMAQLSPYLKFNGNCRQALEFYQSVLGGQLSLQTIGDSPAAGQFPPAMKDRILHGSLAKDDLTIFGTDVAGPELTQGIDALHLSLTAVGGDSRFSRFPIGNHPRKARPAFDG